MEETTTSVGTQIVNTVVEAFTGLAEGIASTVQTVFEQLFITENGGISNLAIWGLVFVGVGAAFGLVKMFTNKLG